MPDGPSIGLSATCLFEEFSNPYRGRAEALSSALTYFFRQGLNLFLSLPQGLHRFTDSPCRHSADSRDDRGGIVPTRDRPYRFVPTDSSLPFDIMEPIGRNSLPHEVPPTIGPNPEGEMYFITICCVPRGANQLACDDIWHAFVETIVKRESDGDLRCGIALAMPDHFHALLSFSGEQSMRQVVTAMKSWMSKCKGIKWQRDFFDHRLRGWESATEKAHYIRMNPVRAGLCEKPEDWPYQR